LELASPAVPELAALAAYAPAKKNAGDGKTRVVSDSNLGDFSFIVELKMLGRRKNMEADGAIAAAFSVLSGKGIDQTIP
jgi:hypothetical protein